MHFIVMPVVLQLKCNAFNCTMAHFTVQLTKKRRILQLNTCNFINKLTGALALDAN